jgi:hypothetical protein
MFEGWGGGGSVACWRHFSRFISFPLLQWINLLLQLLECLKSTKLALLEYTQTLHLFLSAIGVEIKMPFSLRTVRKLNTGKPTKVSLPFFFLCVLFRAFSVIIAIIFQHMHIVSPLYYLYPPTCFGPFGPSSGRYKWPRLQIKMRKYVLY